jgi:hypothetical protein
VYSCGVYKASVDDGTWTKVEEGSKTTNSKANITLTDNNVEYIANVPTPSESDFWFKNGSTSKGYTQFDGFSTSDNAKATLWYSDVTCSYDASSKTYTLTFIKSESWYAWDSTNNVSVYKAQTAGSYSCSAKGDQWTKVEGPTVYYYSK